MRSATQTPINVMPADAIDFPDAPLIVLKRQQQDTPAAIHADRIATRSAPKRLKVQAWVSGIFPEPQQGRIAALLLVMRERPIVFKPALAEADSRRRHA